MIISGVEIDPTFYAVSAQVLVTLVVALVLGLRDLQPDPGLVFRGLAATLLGLALVAAMFAVLIIDWGRSSPFADFLLRASVVVTCLGFTGLVVWQIIVRR